MSAHPGLCLLSFSLIFCRGIYASVCALVFCHDLAN